MRVAAFDCGTNSLRLLVAEVHDGSAPNDVHRTSLNGVHRTSLNDVHRTSLRDVHRTSLSDVLRTMEIVRLGQGVDRTGRISAEAMQRAFDVTRRYVEVCEREQVEAVRFVATSATRDAANADEFTAGIHEIVGVAPEVVSGEEEARLSYAGAVTGLSVADGENILVVDLGGGSTELVLGRGGAVEAAVSLDIGSVRLTERHNLSDPPTAVEVAAAEGDIDAALAQAERALALDRIDTLVGVAGTVTTLTAHALGLREYDSSRVHGCEQSVQAVLAACDELLWMPRAERAALGFMHPGRADVIGAGALIWSRLLGRVAAASGIGRVLTSEHDILDGIALGLARP